MVNPLVCYVLLRGDRLNILLGLLHEIAHHVVHAAGLLVDGDLAIGARATGVLQKCTQVVDLATAAQVINYFIDEVQQFADRITHAEVALLHEIDLRGSTWVLMPRLWSQASVATRAWQSAAMASVSSMLAGTSQMRNSIVWKKG